MEEEEDVRRRIPTEEEDTRRTKKLRMHGRRKKLGIFDLTEKKGSVMTRGGRYACFTFSELLERT